jgi:hypothetical protein
LQDIENSGNGRKGALFEKEPLEILEIMLPFPSFSLLLLFLHSHYWSSEILPNLRNPISAHLTIYYFTQEK